MVHTTPREVQAVKLTHLFEFIPIQMKENPKRPLLANSLHYFHLLNIFIERAHVGKVYVCVHVCMHAFSVP